jgi:hypothetical protein
MHFRLPTQLKSELIDYDPKLLFALKEQSITTPKKAQNRKSNPIGLPTNLIPAEIINPEDVTEAVKEFNSTTSQNRYKKFTDPNDPQKILAILYHFKKCWIAAWTPPENQKDQYLYGYTIAFKNTESVVKDLHYSIKNEIDNYKTITCGRSKFLIGTALVTKEDIKTKPGGDISLRGWIANESPSSWKSRERNIWNGVISPFESQLKQSVPRFDGGSKTGIFDRIRYQSIPVEFIEDHMIKRISGSYWIKNKKEDWIPSAESLISLIEHDKTQNYGYNYGEYASVLHIISTPFFRKFIDSHCQKFLKDLNDPNVAEFYTIRSHWYKILRLLNTIRDVNSVWPDCPIDYYRTHCDELIAMQCTGISYIYDDVRDWLRENMPVASFFKIISKCHAERGGNIFSRDLQLYTWVSSELDDIFYMIRNVLSNDKELVPPSRWRLEEFHDHVQSEAWKINNTNVNLPQDLFPTPIKIDVDGDVWTFFQPVDTHQLAKWGRAARNCVGSSSHYADRVKQKKEFIVLCMINNKPEFTIQLEVSMGVMNVIQIKGTSNKTLTVDQESLYTRAFGQALEDRERELISVPEGEVACVPA